jgi:hypothetical protein
MVARVEGHAYSLQSVAVAAVVFGVGGYFIMRRRGRGGSERPPGQRPGRWLPTGRSAGSPDPNRWELRDDPRARPPAPGAPPGPAGDPGVPPD